MQISLRSQMIAGTAAIVGASAIAMTPVMATPLTLPSVSVPAAAQVAMAAFSSPLAQLSETLELANLYLFDGVSDPTAVTSWPFANFGTEFGGFADGNLPGIIPAVLGPVSALPPYAGYGTDLITSVGVVPQFIDYALPIISQLGYNGSQYLNVTLAALAASGVAIGQGIWTAVGQLLTLDIGGAVTTISDAINTVGTTLLGAGGYVLQSVLANAQAVGAVVLGDLPTLIGAVVAQVGVVVAKSVAIVQDTFGALTTLNIEGAWNAVVDGLLGPSGIPGTILNLTLGEGVQVAAIGSAADIPTSFVPSDRVLAQGAIVAVADALTTAPPPVAALKSARSAASVRSAAAVVEAPAAEAPAAEAPAAEAPAAESSAPVKHRAARGSAQRAAANN